MKRIFISVLMVTALLIGGFVGAAVGHPLVSAQHEDELLERIEELEEQIDEFDERIDDLEEQVDELEDIGETHDGPVGDIGPALLIATWEVDSSSAWSECGDPNGFCACCYQVDWTNPLVIEEDVTFEWEEPYEDGTYEIQPRGESV